MSDEITQKPTNDRARQNHTIQFLPLDRFSAFSDGVFAIAITLLVLELPVPPSNVSILSALRESWPEFLGYIISFAFIGGFWLLHSTLTKVMRHGDSIVYGINLVLLLFVALLPFSTSLMVTHVTAPNVRVAVILYGVNVLCASLILSLIIFYVVRQPGLVVNQIADDKLRLIYQKRWFAVGVNALGVAIAFLEPLVAVGFYLLSTVLLLTLPLVSLRHRLRRAKRT